CFHHFVNHPAKEQGIGLVEALGRGTMQVFVRHHHAMIAAPVQCDVNGIPKRSHDAIRPTDYRSGIGINPAFEITGAASGDARKRINALAASGSRTREVSAAAKEKFGCSSGGIAPTKLTPWVWISSATCWKPISASPRATTAGTGSPEGGPRTFRLLAAISSATPSFWNRTVDRYVPLPLS